MASANIVQCAHCKKTLDFAAGLPTPDPGRSWCSDACHDAWAAEDPTRMEGWVKLSDLTPERTKELFRASGLEVQSDAGKVVLS